MSKISSFKNIENEHDVYRSKDCLEKFCEFLRQHNENNYFCSKNQMKMQKSVTFVKKNLKRKEYSRDKKY